MGLDFTALNNIPLQGAKRGFKEPLEYTEGNLAIQLEKPATEPHRSTSGEAVSGAMYRLESEKKDREHARQMYATYQQNIRRAGILRSDIAKGLKTGEDPLAILLKAIECISLMTGDTVMYIQSKEDLRAVYGWGMRQQEPLKAELEETQRRLAMLTRPELKDSPPDVQKRIERAIQAHMELIKRLEREIEQEERDRRGMGSQNPKR